MYLRIRYCLLLLCCTQLLSAQDISTSQPTTFIRWNGLGLADMMDINISLGAEHHLKNNWSVAADAAWIVQSRYYREAHRTNGFILRSALRRYFKASEHNFAEIELHYKTTYHYMHGWLGRDCVASISSYEEHMPFKLVKQAWGIHVKAGKQYALGKKQRWWLEGYVGPGMHLVIATIANQPNSCYSAEGLIVNNTRPSWQALPALPMGLRLLYRVR